MAQEIKNYGARKTWKLNFLAALKLAVGACANLPKVTSWRIVGLVELIVEQEECYKVFMVWFGMFEPTNLIIDCRID